MTSPLPSSSRAAALAVVLVLGLLAVHAGMASPGGDLSHHYTDHLRHMAEAQALVERGFSVYRLPYAESARGLYPCAAHEGLFPERTAPYPPLGLLLHWPLGALERSGLLAPSLAHRGMTLLLLALGLAASAAGLVLLRPQGRWALAGGVLLLVPLLVGSGANGFYDVTYVLAGTLGLLALARGRPQAAVVLLGVCAALSFRALVFAPVGLWALVEAWRQGRRNTALSGAVAAVLVLGAAASAAALQGTLETIPADNPAHVSHLLRGKPAPLLFVLVSAATAGYLLRTRHVWTALSVLSAVLVALLDRSHGYWHALPLLVPPLVLAAEGSPSAPLPPRHWQVAWGWVVAATVLAFRYPLTPYWQWLVDVARGRVV
ncbi:hypothetical protein JRI60_16530 [Archangium violaceum]|uniref:hypothetical protein n=1 Tax=Archangium violaceum TaxID=83451 RepID=UPI001952724A|nr:hypothetical protein [Archangium violaceum]QRO00521.1 hypothetical protein JRI60_16530 [Archangium violaceum]